MQHPDSDELALFAVLPDDPGVHAELLSHLAGCATCSAEVASLQRVGELGLLSNFGEDAPRPGTHVWDAIAAELGLADAATSTAAVSDSAVIDPGVVAGTTATWAGDNVTALPLSREPGNQESFGRESLPEQQSGQESTTPSGREVPAARRPEDVEAVRALPTKPPPPRRPSPPGTESVEPNVTALPQRRTPRWLAPVAALVVGAALGAGALAISQRDSSDPVEAIAALTPVQGGPAAGTAGQFGQAELVGTGQQQRVVVNAADLPSINGAYEVWLFGLDGRMVSLGALDQGKGEFTVPQGISTTEYRTVDVSDEPADGNPAHSGISVVRGTFS